uniref:Mitochondrial division protein 1 n=1 Tax=Phallusia mammillata TaxID=59560 RepID=A0A6F9DCN8_9ASCI|nr:mitochondrial division protein 1 [Phallusia mammillata]
MVGIEQNKPQKQPQKEKTQKLRSKLRKLWRNKWFSVIALDGHNDVVCDVSVKCGWVASGSRDTSIKLWDISTKKEIRNMSGHTGAVTAVQMMDETESERLRGLISAESDSELMHDMSVKQFPQELLLVTGSTDCYVKLWLLPQGFCIKSIYTFSPITTICHQHDVVFVGSDSGKLTAFNLINRQQLNDKIIHDDSITSLQCNGSLLVSTSKDGNLKLWEICDKDQQPTKVSKIKHKIHPNLKFNLVESNFYAESRQILCSYLTDKLFYGDDGINLKVLDILEETVAKFSNHKSMGFTDACFVISEMLFTTSLDLDTGTGSINVRTLSAESQLAYIASLSCDEFPRFTCATCDPTSNEFIFVTGGTMLLLWKPAHGSKHASDTNLERNGVVHVKGGNIPELGKNFVHSDVESDTSDGETDSSPWWWSKPTETGSNQLQGDSDSDSDESESSNVNETPTSSWSDWCLVL